MKILFFGDIVGRPGREAVCAVLPQLRKKYNPDVVGANAENLAHGRGVSRPAIEEMRGAGVDFFTSGNHVWEGQDAIKLLQEKDLLLLRPANYPPSAPGRGVCEVRVGTKKLLVINLMGRAFMKVHMDCPMRIADEVLKRYFLSRPPSLNVREGAGGVSYNASQDEGEAADAIFVDFHAEATSEKRVLGFYLDGRVSCMVGTHTHVPTADEQILPQGTGYITDVGMCGVLNSSLGADKDIMIKDMLTQVSQKKDVAEGGKAEIGAVLFEIERDGKCKKVKRIREIV